AEGREAARAITRQRRDHVRGVEGPGDSQEQVRRCGGRLERDELQRVVSRRKRLRTLEHATSGRCAESSLCDAAFARDGWCAGSCFGLHESAAGVGCAVDAATTRFAWNGWFWEK